MCCLKMSNQAFFSLVGYLAPLTYCNVPGSLLATEIEVSGQRTSFIYYIFG